MVGWEKFNKIAYKMINLAYINLLWILFTIVGLGVFGVFPATSALFTVVRKLIKDEDNIKIFSLFWVSYRTTFIQSNGFGLAFLLMAYFIYFDLYFLQSNSGSLQFLFPIIIFIMISTIITLLFLFPVFTHFNLKFFQYFKQSFLIAITSPFEVLAIGSLVGIIYFIATMLPGIIPLFTVSVFAYVTTLISFRAFTRIEKRQHLEM